MCPCLRLSILKYGSRARGAIQEKEKHLPLYLGVVAIEKGVWRLSSTMVSQLIYIYIYIYIYISSVEKKNRATTVERNELLTASFF